MPVPNDHATDFQFLTEQSADVICRSGIDRVLRYVSPSCFQLLGWKPGEMVGKGPEAFVVPEDFPALDAAAAQIVSSENHTTTATVEFDTIQTDPIPDTDVQRGGRLSRALLAAFWIGAMYFQVS